MQLLALHHVIMQSDDDEISSPFGHALASKVCSNILACSKIVLLPVKNLDKSGKTDGAFPQLIAQNDLPIFKQDWECR
jgi:hypothetical protein